MVLPQSPIMNQERKLGKENNKSIRKLDCGTRTKQLFSNII
jgi:hypothetical protein